MIRSELLQKIADEHPHLSHNEAERILDTFFGCIIDTLTEGGRVEIRGFGAFTAKQLPSRNRRNPQTGDAVIAPATAKVAFRASKLLLKRMNRTSMNRSEFARG